MMSTETMTVEQAAEAIGQIEEAPAVEQEAPEFAEGEEEAAEPVEEIADEEEAEEESDEPKPEPVPTPKSWSKEDATVFETLPPEAQAVIARREGERDKFVREAGRKAAETRHTVENEARSILAQQAQEHAQAIETYARMVLPQEPDVRLLYSNDPNDNLLYQRQDAAYRAAASQQQQLQQAIAQAQQQAKAADQHSLAADAKADVQRLAEQLPEWFELIGYDEVDNPKYIWTPQGRQSMAELEPIGAELGYPKELMAEASSTDILALRQAAIWKAKADQFDRLNKDKMTAVRAAKGLPKMGQPGTVATRGQQARTGSAKVSDAIAQFNKDRSPEAAAALLGSRNR